MQGPWNMSYKLRVLPDDELNKCATFVSVFHLSQTAGALIFGVVAPGVFSRFLRLSTDLRNAIWRH